jgi:hypothetical protein
LYRYVKAKDTKRAWKSAIKPVGTISLEAIKGGLHAAGAMAAAEAAAYGAQKRQKVFGSDPAAKRAAAKERSAFRTSGDRGEGCGGGAVHVESS